MGEKQLNIVVKGKIATLTSQNFQLVGGNSDYEVVFDFDGDWAGYEAKTALFVYGDKTKQVPFIGNVCKGVAIENSTVCLIGVFAGDIATTTPACVSGIELSIRDVATDLPQAPTDDVYNQIMEMLNVYLAQLKGVPKGGKKGEVLKKVSDADFDYSWGVDEKGSGGGGDYELTEEDKNEIVNDVLQKLEGYTEGLEYILSDDGAYYACDGGNIQGDIKIPPKYNGLPVKEISNSAFYGDRRSYRMLTSVVIPDTVERIEYNAFGSQWSLREIIIKGTPRMNEWGVFDTAALYDVFGDGKGVVPLEIYVPFSEGEVEGAPWGATNATIHYNSPKSKDIVESVTMLAENVARNRDMIMSLEYAVDELQRNMESLTTEATDLLTLINEGGLE